MIRSWGIVAMTGVAQPIFGDALTVAFVPPFGNNLGVLAVASTTRYRVGDRIILGVGQVGQNVVMVDGIKDATHLYVKSEAGAPLNAWVSTTIIALAINCFKIEVQGVDGNAAATWIGSDNTVAVAGGSAFTQLQKVAAGAIPPTWFIENDMAQDPLNTNIGWMIGTAADKVGVAAHVN